MRIDDAVRGVLDGKWRTAQDIFDLHGYGALSTTRGQLNVLTEMGIVERQAQNIPTGFVYVYRRRLECSSPSST